MNFQNERERFRKGAVEYLNKLDEDSIHYHYVKPFVGGPDFHPFFQDFYAFLNIIQLLNLRSRSKILDFGCGTGWISVYLAKLGHIVTGIDISPQFISIANMLKNNEKMFPYKEQKELTCNFLVHDVEEGPFISETKFDCVILYSVLHHFVYPEKILEDIIEYNLIENGKVVVYEGVKPPSGSIYEKENEEIMNKYDVLERPFSQDELTSMLKNSGYDRITFYEPINGLFLRNDTTINTLKNLLLSPPNMNAVLAFKPATSCNANITLKTKRFLFKPNENIKLTFEVKNIGKITWRFKDDDFLITFGARLFKEGIWISDDIPRAFLQNDVPPNTIISFEWNWTAPNEIGNYSLIFDMIYENYCWFKDKGSEEFVFNFQVQS